MGYAPNTNYLLISVDGKRLDLTLKRLGLNNDSSQGQLWQMNYNRPSAKYEVDPKGFEVVGSVIRENLMRTGNREHSGPG